VSTKKNRLNVSLDEIEREKLEKLAKESGLSLSRTIAQLIRKAKSKPMSKDDSIAEAEDRSAE
jgi:macrodomain Ter protein organizer (MatP/YcbG family)